MGVYFGGFTGLSLRRQPGADRQRRVQVVRKTVELPEYDTIHACKRVVGKHRRNCNGKSDSGHDQRFTDRSRDLVDCDLTRPRNVD